MENVTIVGAGLIGRAWAIVFARAGLPVSVWDNDPNVRTASMDQIGAMLETGGFEPSVIDRISITDALEDALEGADWVQESGPERLEVKRALFAELDRIAPESAILASSSSALVASRFAAGLQSRERILVAHPVNPPHAIPLVELCPSPDTSPDVMTRAEALMHRVGQVPVRMSREIEGFVLNRLQAVLLAEALHLVDQGIVSVDGLDNTMRHGLARRWAFLGPLRTIFLNAPGGMPDYMNRYGPTMAALADDAARGDAFNQGAAEKISAALPEVDTIPELSAWRDAELIALDQFLRSRTPKTKGF